MGVFGKAAIYACDLVAHHDLSPIDAWTTAIAKYTRSESSRRKVCPREAFIGLCESGFIKGITIGDHGTRNVSANAGYATVAWKTLQSEPEIDRKKLWRSIAGAPAHENGQLDVVLSLWQAQEKGKQ